MTEINKRERKLGGLAMINATLETMWVFYRTQFEKGASSEYLDGIVDVGVILEGSLELLVKDLSDD